MLPVDRPVPPLDSEWFETNALGLIEWVMTLAGLARENAEKGSGAPLATEAPKGGGLSPQRPAVPA